jgi:glycosyltransferase involved in cell wall biosynthesis
MISIVIPAYDRVDLLRLTLNSIKQQKDVEFEIIVIDDNSLGNDIYETCKEFSVIYYKNKNNYGAQVSRNKGVELSKYEYIAFVDSDDLWESENKLYEQYRVIKDEPNVSIIFTALKYIDISGNLIKESINSLDNGKLNTNFSSVILKKDIIGTYSSVMIRKKQFIEAGMCNINLPARQDWDLWIRLSKLGNAHVINNCFTLYRIHDNQISSGINKKLEGFSQLLSYHKKYFFNKKAISAFHFHLFKLILLQKISKIKSDGYNEVLKENNTAATIISFLVLILIYTPLINKFLINKLSGTYLFKGLVK